MSLEIRSELNSRTRAESQPDTSKLAEQAESVLFTLAGGLAAILISALWVSLSLG